MAFPLTFSKEQNSSPAPSQATAIDRCFRALTPVGTVNELLTLAPAKLSNAWKLDVAERPDSLLDITIAIFSPYALNFNGPIAANCPAPTDRVTSLAAILPAAIATIAFLFVLKALLSVSNPPFTSPLIICCAAVPALAASAKANPAPRSRTFTEKLRFLRLLVFFLLTAIISPCGADAYRADPLTDAEGRI